MSRRLTYRETQEGRTLRHPKLPQPIGVTLEHGAKCGTITEQNRRQSLYTFVVCADTQLGFTSGNIKWDHELALAKRAVRQINMLDPRPKFCCCCGDLVDMEASFYADKADPKFTQEECFRIQDEQNRDFQRVFAQLHPDIAMVCLCGNHDVGNRPTKTSIDRFKNTFGDDYLAFWVNGSYNIVLNTNLFSDPSKAKDLLQEQLSWLEDRLKYAQDADASHVFVFGHHPWFLYNEDEQAEEMHSFSPYPKEFGITEGGFPDSYFHVPSEHRMLALDLFKRYGVTAAFAGHFHQNMVAKTSFGMDMITTAALSYIFESNGKPADFDEPSDFGIRVVTVNVPKEGKGTFSHTFQVLQDEDEDEDDASSQPQLCKR